ncbi:aldose epimerase family protein [Methylovirgula sp. 4M-Z18]|uniref:aldose epimerase family protein n=1 Tax=Methylovirgula sp. 4M-Z18 TaxID=2293567 RepID=UPI000E2FB9EC|nr:aldose epimerase family protein [Methylovirgula sp. 4M-Z18]RFB81218.1 galactose mutarotase [Methylovirgula sp. 4M-Z18]
MRRVFGTYEGTPIEEISLTGPGISAKIITWGASVRDLVIATPRGPQRVVIGFDQLDHYLAYAAHAGAIAGRYANRIDGASFSIDGKQYTLPKNEFERQTLHGGGRGQAFGERPWQIAAFDATSVTLTLHSPDGDAGFPGALDVSCTYRLTEPATLRIELTARTQATTALNLASHSYFHLDLPSGFANRAVPPSIDHEFEVASDFYAPLDRYNIPTGEILNVADTVYDFRTRRPIRHESGTKYDMGFVVRDTPYAGHLPYAATLHGPATGMRMDVFTTEPHLQFYDAAHFHAPVAGLDGAQYGAHCGICLEPQRYPDAPNRRHFGASLLRPDETYAQVTECRFQAG